MADSATSAPMLAEQIRLTDTRTGPRRRRPGARTAWAAVAAAVIGLAVLWVVLTGMRPAYDAYGWLVWGHQALRLNLDTAAAPSWKPLPFLFTFPFALGGRAALWLWMVTAVASAFAAPVFAGRIAYRLAGPAPGRRLGPAFAAVFAGLGVLGIAGYWHFVLIATADPMMVALCLAAIDSHLCGRRTVAWACLVLACLGRPEAWAVTGLYALWSWRSVPAMRRQLILGSALIPLLWFGLSRLTSSSWFIASDVALGSTTPLPGDRVSDVLNGYFSLYELPMQLAVACAVGFAVLRRDRAWLCLAATAVVWLVVEIALALHGWAPVPRYVFEPAAVAVVLAGAAAGRLLSVGSWPGRLAAVAALALLVVVMVPHARVRARLAHNGIVLGQTWARVINRLETVVDRDGRNRILACGQPVTTVAFQSILAWEMDENVADVGWDPNQWIAEGQPMVYFQPYFAGWKIYPVHSHSSACRGLTTTTASN